MHIYQPSQATTELVAAFERLIPQLNDTITPPTLEELDRVIKSESTCLFVGEKENKIIATISLVIYKIPTGTKAWIEDVITDESARGHGYGKQLMEHAIAHARSIGIKKINLTSSPFREAANKLYLNIGFELRETNMYRLELE